MQVQRGVVKWFDEVKGYGFIQPDEGQKDLFFHRDDLEVLEGTVDKGERVEFQVGQGSKGAQAKHIRILGES